MLPATRQDQSDSVGFLQLSPRGGRDGPPYIEIHHIHDTFKITHGQMNSDNILLSVVGIIEIGTYHFNLEHGLKLTGYSSPLSATWRERLCGRVARQMVTK